MCMCVCLCVDMNQSGYVKETKVFIFGRSEDHKDSKIYEKVFKLNTKRKISRIWQEGRLRYTHAER